MASTEMESTTANKRARIFNHMRIQLLCEKGAKLLEKIFRERWAIHSTFMSQQPVSSTRPRIHADGQWKDGSECGGLIYHLCGREVPKKMREKLREGNAQSWDITMMCAAIRAVSSKSSTDALTTQLWKNQDAQIDIVRDVRNEVYHEAVSALGDEQFAENWTRLLNALVELGADRVELEAVKHSMPCSPTFEGTNINPKMAQLKEEANRAFMAKEYPQAVALYSRALKLDGLDNEQRAILHSNRSASHLLVGGENAMELSVDDARQTVLLKPEWWKGYYRLGRAYNVQKKYEKAIGQLETALALNPDSHEVTVELSAARLEYGVLSRDEIMTPSQQRKTEQEINEMAARALGIAPEAIAQAGQFVENVPIHGDVKQGHRYLHGHGVPQDYKEAAQYFAKAAAKGSPEGMYNLALLHGKGLGVKLDFATSLYWLKKAASMTPNPPFFSLGIAEAQHSLGLRYSEGVGVEKNYKIAAEWYTKAVQNNCAAAANNLGVLYLQGNGVERSLEKAFQLYQLSAKLNDTNGMMNLADCYLSATGTGHAIPTKQDREKAIKWLETAASQGDLSAQRQLDEVKNCGEVDLISLSLHTPMPTELADPLDHKQHYAAVKLAADKGSPTAKQVLTIWECMKESWNSFKTGDHKALVSSLSKAIRLDHQSVKISELFRPVLNERLSEHPDELESIICHVATNMKNVKHLPGYVVESLEKFPTDPFLLEILAACLLTLQDFNGALRVVTRALPIHPNACTLLYMRATIFAMMDGNKWEEAHEAFNAFLAVAPKDHPKVPAAHYRNTYYYMHKGLGDGNMAGFFRSYEAGLAAEKIQLPCFLPYDFPPKYRLEKIYNMAKLKSQQTPQMNLMSSSQSTRKKSKKSKKSKK